ncbi:MAG TPA: DUF4337 family protein [Gemmataceae bacterium]|nr:DUF4337 family protein [Gemmataceae bacterium]
MADTPPAEAAAAPAAPAPKGVWGAVLTATPIALTALATAFAGLSSSEMTRAMYYRSLAAQHQSRAGDQWAFFQAKRIRGTTLESTVETFQAMVHPDGFDPFLMGPALQSLRGHLAKSPQSDGAIAAIEKAEARLPPGPAGSSPLGGGDLPKVELHSIPDPANRQIYEEVIRAIQQRQTEDETAALVAKLSPAVIEEATRLAETDADLFDKACEPTNELVKQLKAAFRDLAQAMYLLRRGRGAMAPTPEGIAEFDRLDASFRMAVMDYEARRYRQEANLNRRAAEAYEVRVRRSGVESDRHRQRSQQFFYSMLLAQLGATVSALALARAQRSLLWLLAAAAGVVALCFTGYVYLTY